MPGGFTWADALVGFQAFGQTALAVAAVVTAVALTIAGLYMLGSRRRDAIREWLAVGEPTPCESVKAMAHERLAQHVALPYTDDVPFAGRADWPKRKAS